MFTNWLTSEVPKTREVVNPPPDVIVEVGPPPFTRFPVHSSILSAQSGYFRAAISREVGKLSENPIYLPNITVDHFTPLLTYMYTGYLELNFENIFGVLLATHLLHMPRALEICRDFLAHSQRQQSDFYSAAVPTLPSTTSKVVRPIASKASNLGLNFVSAPKQPGSLLVPSHDTPFKTLVASPTEEKPAKIPKLQEPPPEKPVKPVPIRKIENSSPNDGEKVIVDIASCDGPVRFRRVVNDAYEKNKKQIPIPVASGEVKFPTNSSSFHQQMMRNINEQYSKQKSISSHNSEESENSQTSGEVYTCVYCNHTFKSKYCYQKHAKRHLNPLNSVAKCRDDCDSSDGDVVKVSKEAAATKRDSIKPLDMNVQYYPCKTCGCKFPSYYFVHKHRKMCHPEIGAENSLQPMTNENSEDNSIKDIVVDDKEEN